MSFVYFIETADQRFIKIGFSTRVLRRISDLGTLRPTTFQLHLLGAIPGTAQTEKWLHCKFASDRDNGEWFKNTDRLQSFISAIGLIQPTPETCLDSANDDSDIALVPIPQECRVVRRTIITSISKEGAAVEMARKRAESLTPERRSEIARNAVNERWKKNGKK